MHKFQLENALLFYTFFCNIILTNNIIWRIIWLKKQYCAKGVICMSFPISSGLLDALVLAVISNSDTYGYEITQLLRTAVDVSESTLYPVMRRLQKNGMLETYDKEFQGRNRRYYKITEIGLEALSNYKREWTEHKRKVDQILGEGISA